MNRYLIIVDTENIKPTVKKQDVKSEPKPYKKTNNDYLTIFEKYENMKQKKTNNDYLTIFEKYENRKQNVYNKYI